MSSEFLIVWATTQYHGEVTTLASSHLKYELAFSESAGNN